MKVVSENALKRLINLIKAKFNSLAKVATSGSYADLSNKPTIPSVGNGKITIKQGGIIKGTFTVNQNGATGIELDDKDTHYASGTVVTNDATKTGNYGAALTNGNVHLNHVENGAVKNSHKITGAGATTVTSDASGNIIITSTDNNTTYGVATASANGLMSSTDKSKLDNLQVGGRNLYTQSTAFQNLITNATTERDTDINGFIVTCNSDGDAHPRIKDIIEGKTWYTVSAYIKADTSCTMAWDVCDHTLGSINITTEYQYFKGTVYNSKNDSPVYNFVDIEVFDQGANNKLYFKNFKVEKGTMATDWTPAPEDLAEKDHTHTKSQITDFPTSLKNPKGLIVQVNGDGASEVRYDGSEAKTINFVAGDNVTLTQKTSENKVTIAAKDTTYSAGTGLSLSGTTFNHSNSVTAGTAQGDASKTLTFGGTFTVPTVTYDAQGHVTGKGTTTMTMPANPNTDTKNTAGSTDTSSKIFLIGAKSQAANPQTYSHDTAYVGTDGCLYSGGAKVSVNGHTHGVATTSENGFMSKEDKAKIGSLSTVATTGSYNDLSDKPTIPSVGNGRITIKQGGIKKGTFTVNQSGATGIELDDTDTHYTSKNVVASSADDTNNTTTALTNGNVFLNSVENGSVTSSHNIKGIGGTTVSTDTSGNIIIKGTTGTYSTGTDKTAGITKLYSGLGSNTDGTMTQLAIDDALAGKAGSAHTHTKSEVTDFPTSLKNPKGLIVQVNGDGASEVRYDGSVAKTINIKAGSNITITSDSSGNITISSTASAGSVTGDVGTVVYEATSGGLYCDGSTANTRDNSKTIEDSSFKYKRLRFYCQGYYGLICTDMPLDREHPTYATGGETGKHYGGVIFPTAENGNINNTGIGPSNHMYYELKWRVTKESAGWRVRVVDSGWLGLNAGKTTNDDYTGNASTSNAGTGYVSWNQRHNNAYCIYKIVAYTD